MANCNLCIKAYGLNKRGNLKTPKHFGSSPTCAFTEGVFSPDNWNCQTVGKLRDLCYEGQEKMPAGVDYQYCDDQKYASIHIDDVWVDDKWIGLCLWITWYKNRGRTDDMWILNADKYNENPPRRPTEVECLAVIDYYQKKGKDLTLDELAQNVQPMEDVQLLFNTWPDEENDGFEESIDELRQGG